MADQQAHTAMEREVKLGAWPGFAVPDLGDLESLRAEAADDEHLDARYFDAADLRLLRSGITLRYRTGGHDDGWTVKLPSRVPLEGDGEAGGAGLSRHEVVVAGGPDSPPEGAVRLVRAFLRTAPLEQVARIATLRRRVRLVGPGGVPVGELDDDEVTLLDRDRIAVRFREVEVEVDGTVDEDVLASVVDRLRAAGAGEPEPTPKLARALGPRALAPADVVAGELGGSPTAAEVVQAGLARAVLRLLDHDPVVRLDAGIEGVHQARVAMRRLRSDLRTFRDVLDEDWATALREELRWVAAELGNVRDADVLLQRLRRDVAALEAVDRTEAHLVLRRLEDQRAADLASLQSDLDSPRYAALLDDLVEAVRHPRFTPEAERPAAEVLPRLVRKPWRKLAAEARAIDDDSPDPVLHHVRIRAKRARYAADVAVPVIGEPAKEFAAAMSSLQDLLGDHQDAVVAQGWLRQAVVGADAGAGIAVGLLIARQQERATRTRRRFDDTWAAASDKKLRAWLP